MSTPTPPRPRSSDPSADSAATVGSTRAALLLAALGACLVLLVQLGWQPLLDLDRRVARSLHESALSHPGWTGTARVLTDWVWDTWTMRAVLAVTVLWLWWRAQRASAVRLLVLAVFGTLLQQLLKAVLGRERPRWEEPVDSANFAALPSGHAMTAALACGLLVGLVYAYDSRRWLRWLVLGAAAVSVVGVSWTRVYLGVHWLTDVVVGSLLGLAIAMWPARAVLTGIETTRRRTGPSARSDE
ncbi:phosphatase PAP2 family protein [Streptomyces oceani]|uniref:Phosphatidic acid phosphatase type 2/haloperoxidase domain-containing protein n=1 Tax=Streptomyces oceani TaxID=1075402 RepID=A0A1E7JXU9_9ACTN|nr:phosphatase PAP2 family protein [Streptomyces oceani]OEU96523.1 hypothetical protein AN216_19750 [Streptomyces oceani]